MFDLPAVFVAHWRTQEAKDEGEQGDTVIIWESDTDTVVTLIELSILFTLSITANTVHTCSVVCSHLYTYFIPYVFNYALTYVLTTSLQRYSLCICLLTHLHT